MLPFWPPPLRSRRAEGRAGVARGGAAETRGAGFQAPMLGASPATMPPVRGRRRGLKRHVTARPSAYSNEREADRTRSCDRGGGGEGGAPEGTSCCGAPRACACGEPEAPDEEARQRRRAGSVHHQQRVPPRYWKPFFLFFA